jgi:Mrp family chromosome partitioning ATPase
LGKLVTISQPGSAVAEAFRALRVNLRFAALDKTVTKLVVTSASATEGKSFVAANLAVTMAQSGYSVILIDADMRRPTQHKVFGLENESGLSALIVGSGKDEAQSGGKPGVGGALDLFSEATPGDNGLHGQETPVDGLHIITSGPVPPNPADLLASSRMEALIEQLESQADILIFDAPPVLAVIDAVVLATQADGVLLVSEFGRTRYAAVREAANRLRRVDANLLGFVLNRVSPRSGGYYAYEGHAEQDQGQPPAAKLFSVDGVKEKLAGIGFLRGLIRAGDKRNTA